MNGKAPQDARYLAAARAHGAMIERLARGYEADPELRRDLVQEIHAALWRSFAIFEGQCAEKSWVHRIAHNVGVTHMMTGRRGAQGAARRARADRAICPTATIPSTAPANARCPTGCSPRSTACSPPTARSCCSTSRT